MIRYNNAKSGRHFLQIPGPTNGPDRILRAIDHPTIDHRGPEFGVLRKSGFKTALADVAPGADYVGDDVDGQGHNEVLWAHPSRDAVDTHLLTMRKGNSGQ